MSQSVHYKKIHNHQTSQLNQNSSETEIKISYHLREGKDERPEC